MAVFGAMISYAMQGLSFILLRKNLPHIERPYRSPSVSGRGGDDRDRARHAVLPAAGSGLPRWRVRGRGLLRVGPLYFAFIGRHRLILSPEEEFAMSRGERGHA
jgi:ethanolamine permease